MLRTVRALSFAPLALALLAPGAAALGVFVDIGADALSPVDALVEATAAPLPAVDVGVAIDAPFLPDVALELTAPRFALATDEALPPIPVDVGVAGDARAATSAAPPAPHGPPEPVPAAVQAAAATGVFWLILERLGFGRAAIGAFAALYFRVQPNELLEHDRRERVVQLVRERPGIGPQDVASALGTGWGVTSYHLDRLERAGFVTSQRVGHHRCYFLPGAIPRDEQRAVGLFRGDTTRRIAQLLVEKPGLTQTELCGALGLSASAASKQVARLEAAELLRREAGERGARLFPQPALTGALATN